MSATPSEPHLPLFTIEEANHLLPELRTRLMELREAYAEAAAHKSSIQHAVPGNGGGRTSAQWLDASRRVAAQFRWLTDHGIVLQDIEEGLVDFPAVREGEEVFLCWKLGEEKVGHWHYPGSGFASRRPID